MPSLDDHSLHRLPEQLFDLSGVARQIGLPLDAAARLAREVPVPWRHGEVDLYDPPAVALFGELAQRLPRPLPRLPGSRWRMKVCEVCGVPYDPPGPNAKWCGLPCKETAIDERRAAEREARR